MRLLVVVLAGCTVTMADARLGAPSSELAARERFHMRRDFDGLASIQRLLVAGRLDAVRARAAAISAPAARELATAPDLAGAIAPLARIAVSCAGCHLATRANLAFASSPLPVDDGTERVRMFRHRWAVDRVWEGVVGPNEPAWRAGLEVLAQTEGLRPIATAALAGERETLDERGATYAALMRACLSCHPSR